MSLKDRISSSSKNIENHINIEDILIDRYYDNITESILQDMYKKPYLDHIDDLVYDILHTDLTVEKMYDKYRIYLIPVDPQTKIKKPKNGKMSKYDPIEDKLIYNAGYDQLNYTYKFEIRDDVDTLYNVKERLTRELKEVYVHENTHEQQNQGKHRLQPYDNGDGDLINYLSQYQEIAAMARGVAYALGSRISTDEHEIIIRAIANNNDILNILPEVHKCIIDMYKKIGGKVWKKFLKYVYLFFINPETTIFETVEYRQWLREHPN